MERGEPDLFCGILTAPMISYPHRCPSCRRKLAGWWRALKWAKMAQRPRARIRRYDESTHVLPYIADYGAIVS
jgi:hypothetical protein